MREKKKKFFNRIEEFPIDNDIVEKFIFENEKKWEKNACSDKFIFINLSMVRMQMSWVIPKLIYAKGLEAESGATPIAITWRKNELLLRLFKSFGIEHLVLDELVKKDIKSMLKAFLKMLKMLLFGKKGEYLKELEYKGFNIGKSLYEDILRTSNLSTIKCIYNKEIIKKIFHILATVYALDSYCKTKKPVFAVMDDYAYHEAIFIKLFKKNGAEILHCSNKAEEKIVINNEYEIQKRTEKANKKIRETIEEVNEYDAIVWTEKYLEEKIKGNVGKELDRDAYKGKKRYSKEEIKSLLNIPENKKNIVVMAHTFSDAVFNYNDYFYRDYYDWLEKTLLIASKIEEVNWIVKPHPIRKAYNENVDTIEKLFEKHKKENFFYLPDQINTEIVRYLADVIITVGGSAGGEFSCYGIPTVIIGSPYYKGFGYTIEPQTRSEYEKILSNVSKIKQLNENQIATAKKVFYIQFSEEFQSKNQENFSDEFSKSINGKYYEMIGKMSVEYFQSNKGTETYNNESLKRITEFIEKYDVKRTEYFERGKKRAKQMKGKE